MATVSTYAQGQLLEPLEMTLTKDDAPFVLNAGTDTLVLRYTLDPPELGGTRVQKTPVIVDAPTGQIKYDWIAGDTDVPGVYYGQITVTRSAKPISFPDDGTYFTWTITPTI